mmetsp:Transcript_10577/g.20042  ORF Transcript_10577/g.20042 Transcript_10577/m.20042 type:complete len:201 (+) Transcript_10577:351-953(+)
MSVVRVDSQLVSRIYFALSNELIAVAHPPQRQVVSPIVNKSNRKLSNFRIFFVLWLPGLDSFQVIDFVVPDPQVRSPLEASQDWAGAVEGSGIQLAGTVLVIEHNGITFLGLDSKVVPALLNKLLSHFVVRKKLLFLDLHQSFFLLRGVQFRAVSLGEYGFSSQFRVGQVQENGGKPVGTPFVGVEVPVRVLVDIKVVRV